ncbi:hypothetical protein OEZ86_012469 [Tetradesmus obliquus]|nr:hypothetical protein OEZ86_012469 [Tetradesmus obliquus]
MATTGASLDSQKGPERAFQVTSSQALQTALQHPFLSSDAKTVCSLLQTCKSWRVAQQQCAAGNLDISTSSMKGQQQLALFCCWLQQQGGLVASIHCAGPKEDADEDVSEQLMVLGLQAACGRAATTSSAAAAAVARMQLRSLSTSVVRSAAQLRALPAAALTHLHLNMEDSSGDLTLDSSSIAAALVQLCGLRSLMLNGPAGYKGLSAVGQLTQLTSLNIECVSCSAEGSCDLHLLPQQLHECDLTLLVESGGSAARMALGHITALRTLNLCVNCSTAEGSSLPPSLTDLQVWLEEGSAAVSMQHLNIPALQQLQQLRAGYCLQEPELLESLSSLRMLMSLDISYAATAAVHAAALWQHVPALHTLRLEKRGRDATLDPSQSLLLLQGLAAATSLTALDISRHVVHRRVPLCAHLAGLTRLKHLGLRLDNCGLTSAAALPSIATLTGLTWLSLAVSPYSGAAQLALGREDLLLLAPLRKLARLDFVGFFSPDAVQELWDAELKQWRQQQA